MKRQLKIILYFLLVLMLIVFGISGFTFAANHFAKSYEGDTTESGVINLSNRNIDDGDLTYLTGDWEFYWRKFIVTDGVDEVQPDITVNVPSFWNKYSIENTKLGNGGYASYKLRLKGIKAEQPFIVFVPNLPAAYRVFINGNLVFSSGTISKDVENTRALPSFTAYPVTLNTDEMLNGEAELVIEVSCHFSSGLTLTPVLLNYETYSARSMFMLGARYIFIGIIIFAGIFVFLMSRKIKDSNSYSAWFSLLCLFLAIRIMISCEGFWASNLLLFGLSYELMYFLIYVLTFIIKLILFVYTSKSLSLRLPQNLMLAFGAFFLVYASVPVLFTDNIFDPDFFMLLQMATFIFDAYILYNLCEATVDKVRNALLHMIGYVSLVIGIYVDVLYVNGYINVRVSWFMPLMFLIFIGTSVYTMALVMVDSYNESSKSAELSKELSEINMSLMLSQIQPHFLYNALNTIKYMIKKDPKSAESAIVSFSKYLRANMDSLSEREPVPFDDELNHIKNYAEIELLRFGDRINIVYDIQCTSFKLPALTIQPLVENAIKHGVNQKADGGIVTISTYEDKMNFYVSVADDGVGYDVKALPESNRSHIGLTNITSRLDFMLGAKVSTESRLGYGTTVLITIPKNEKSILTEEQ